MTKRDLGFVVLGVCCTILIVQASLFNGQTVQAQSAAEPKPSRCDFTYILDGGKPNIGKAGEIKYSPDWAKVVEGGWTLKAAVGERSSSLYIFEKCK